MSSKAQNLKQTFVLFKQLSMDFIPSDTKTNNRIKHEIDENHQLHLQFGIYYPSRTLLIEFKNALKYSGYKCIQIGDRQLLIIRLKLLDRFNKLFLCRHPPKFILSITTHQFLSVRRISIKPLKSNSNFSQKRISFIQLSTQINHIGQILLSLRNLHHGNYSELNQLDNQYKQDFYSLDATSYYMFSRMLVQSNYTLGKKIITVFNKFKDQQNIQNCNQSDLRWLHQALNQISSDLLQGFNCSRKELLQILAYCRKSVQQYYYNIHHQYQVNHNRIHLYDSQSLIDEINELNKTIPQTTKQFLSLQRTKTSMQIFKQLFLINLIFKAQIQIKNIEQDIKSRIYYLIRRCFSGLINQKLRILKYFGYQQSIYIHYIHQFNFDHQIIF